MNIENVMLAITDYFSNPAVISTLKNALIISAACFLVCGLFRLIFGHNGTAVKAVSAVLGILILYCIRIAIDQFALSFGGLFAALPFVEINSECVSIIPFTTLGKNFFSVEFFNLILLVFLFCFFEDIFPEGKHLISWIFLRCVGIVGAFAIYSVFQFLITRFLPDFIITYAPALLIALLILFLAVTLFKWLIGLILGVTAGPVIGGIYTFFVSHIIGKQLTKSALTSSIFLLLVYLADYYGKTVIILDDSILSVLIPIILILAAFRYLFKKIF